MVAESQQSAAMANKSATAANGGGNASKGRRSCKIILLDGSECEIDVDKAARGSELFEKITQRLNLWEKDYFGLSYRDGENNLYWLNYEKKISKQMQDRPWLFRFEVKFYPPEPGQLQEDITRYYLCLQIQNDILSGKLPCSFVTYALLGSYLVQAQLGDYDQLQRRIGTSEEEYLLDFRFAPYHSKELLQKVCELHKAHRGMTPEDAELRYLEIGKTLAMYGVDLHTAKDMENSEVSLGVCSSGLLVFKNQLRVNRFAWPKILKISFRRTHFYIKIRPGEFEQRDTTIAFRLPNYKAAERLWKSCVEHHTFFRLMSPEPQPKKSLLRMGSSRFRFSGRTHYQTRLASALIERQPPNFQRSQSARFPTRTTVDGLSKDQVKPAHTSESATPLHYHGGSPREHASQDKMRPHSADDRYPLPVYSLQRDKDLVEYALPADFKAPPQKEYYIIAPQKSPSVDAEKSQRSVDENNVHGSVSPFGTSQKIVTRIETELERNQTSPRLKAMMPVFEQVHPLKSGLIEWQPMSVHGIESPSDAKKRLSGPNDRAVMEEIEKVIEQGPTNVERVVEPDGTVRMTTSSSQIRTVKRTVQRETVETFITPAHATNIDEEFKMQMTHGIDVYSDGDIDHDAELTAAIMEATKMNPAYTVEKIEVKRHGQY